MFATASNRPRKQSLQLLPVRYVQFLEAELLARGQPFQTGFFQTNVVVIIEVIDSMDRVTTLEQL